MTATPDGGQVPPGPPIRHDRTAVWAFATVWFVPLVGIILGHVSNRSRRAAGLSSTLAAGETVTGYIAFDVPSPHGTIVYAPNSDGQPIAQWSY